MMSIRKLTTYLLLVSILVIYVFFWAGYLEQRNMAAHILLGSIKSDLADTSYSLSKNVHSLSELMSYKADLDRLAANNDTIASFLITKDDRVLVYTDPSNKEIPSQLDILDALPSRSIEALIGKEAFSTEIVVYEKLSPVKLKLIAFLDSDYIKSHLTSQSTHILLVHGIPPILVFSALWFVFNRKIFNPLTTLKRYAYDPSTVPPKFGISELEGVRSQLSDTFTRLDMEREELYRRSVTDKLTGLANRDFLSNELNLMIDRSRKTGQEFAVLFLDLDNFKKINDTLGHEAGDILLVSVADALRSVFRTGDVIARLGGDEFVVVVSHYKEHAGLVTVLNRLLRTIDKDWFIKNGIDVGKFHLSVSIGVSVYPFNGRDPITLLKNADIAMYEAKRGGKGCFNFFSDSMNEAVQYEVELERDIRHALERDQFELHYQAKVDVSSNSIVGTEALLRWHHPTKGYVPPDEFLGHAEKNGLINEIGLWVLDTAIKQQMEWLEETGVAIQVSVNLSTAQLRDNTLHDKIDALIQKYDANAQLLDLEITETLLIENLEYSLTMLDKLKALGVSLSLDDFGTGYSSLSYLKYLPVDSLKIDKSFIDDFRLDTGAVFIETMVSMGKSLGMLVISEGVETQDQIDFLRKIDCDAYQGYLFCKPMPPHEFKGLLSKNAVSAESCKEALALVTV